MEAAVFRELLETGKRIKVTIRSGHLGCADAQDACHEYGFLILRKTAHGDYVLDTPNQDDPENIVCVDDEAYILDVIDSFEAMD